MNPTAMSKDQANELLTANAHFANHLYSFIASMSLKCAVQLEIADTIDSHGKPMSLSDLAAALPIHAHKAKFLPQLMRLLVHLGYFSIDSTRDIDGYALTTASHLLLKDHPYSVKPYLLFVLNPLLVSPWISLSEWFRNEDDVTPFQSSNGVAIWESASHSPEINKLLNATMAGDSKMVGDVLMSNHHGRRVFEGLSSLVDVGGGFGEMARAIAHTFPETKCVVLDLPHVVKGLEGTANLSFVAGDMFVAIPPANAVLLKWILHDWNDENSVKILKQCRKAITSNVYGGRGKVIIIEVVMDEDEKEEDYKTRETQLFFDMEMMVLARGKERTKREWEKLFLEAGFNGGFKVFRLLGFRSIIEVYP